MVSQREVTVKKVKRKNGLKTNKSPGLGGIHVKLLCFLRGS